MLRGLIPEKTVNTIDALRPIAAKIEAMRTLKRDFIASTDTLTVKVQDDRTPVLEIPDQGDFPLLPVAHDQIGGHTGIPSKYYDRLLGVAPDLLATNVNYLFRLNPAKRMIRTLGGDARSFNSNSYRRIENEQIAEVALPVLYSLPGVQIPSAEVTDRRLYIHFVVPTVQGEVKKGDVVQAGGVLSNSEVGLGGASVSGLIWRLWCLNGAKTELAYRKTHVGRQIDDNEDLWADDTRRADDSAILLKIRDMVKAVVDETRFRQTLGRMQDLAGAKITGEISKTVEVLGAAVGATETERGGILRALIEGGDLSAWGALNAVTAQAHSASSYDRAVEIEAMGGNLLNLAPTEWKRILEAA